MSSLPVGHAWRTGGLDEARVATLAAGFSGLPPILVRRADRLVIDGAHRVAAARRLGVHRMEVEWFEGGALQAFGAFTDRNAADGLAVTGRDRERGVAWVLDTEAMWSDRRIARACGVSPKTVARLRVTAGPASAPGLERRIGRDGRARPVHAGALRARVVEAIDQDPAASLRTIAARLGVSPETVRRARRDRADRTPGPGRPDCGDQPVVPVALHLAAPAGSWREDRALCSTARGASFVEWFDATAVEGPGWLRADDVPLSRVYEIADEARRRAAFWSELADGLQARSRRH